ncbi:MAG TPA: hypothetical protein VMF06_12290 [Candidatus Limnocylindria bacterium]|jgi:hypothetical protein|nr:hypothetical protein [Candidatus Limnocylindria bacterium]
MKKLMILGAMLGFLIGATFGILQECSWPAVLWRSSVAAAAAGLLLRWWGKLWISGLRAAYAAKNAAAIAQAVPADTKAATPPAPATFNRKK